MSYQKRKKELLNRLARAEGHFRKVRKMVEGDEYCVNIITQLLAVESALRSIDELILKNHLETCVKEAMISGKGVSQKIEEIMQTFKLSRK